MSGRAVVFVLPSAFLNEIEADRSFVYCLLSLSASSSASVSEKSPPAPAAFALSTSVNEPLTLVTAKAAAAKKPAMRLPIGFFITSSFP